MGVQQDYAESMRWYLLAAEQGYAHAQYEIGVMYAEGHGVPQDITEAYLWWNLAVTYLEVDAIRDTFIRTRDQAAERLTPEQLAAAQSRALKFFEAHPPK